MKVHSKKTHIIKIALVNVMKILITNMFFYWDYLKGHSQASRLNHVNIFGSRQILKSLKPISYIVIMKNLNFNYGNFHCKQTHTNKLVNTEEAFRHNDERIREPKRAAQTHQLFKSKKRTTWTTHTHDAQLHRKWIFCIIAITFFWERGIIKIIEIIWKDIRRNWDLKFLTFWKPIKSSNV